MRILGERRHALGEGRCGASGCADVPLCCARLRVVLPAYPEGPYAIAIEGIDGCGKTTQVRLLTERLQRAGVPALLTRQPGGTPNLDVREILLWTDLCAKSRHLLFAADNAQHVYDTIRPALADGSVVVMDRAIGSAFAYQGWGEGFGEERVRLVYGWGTDDFRPDLTCFLDLSPAGVAERKRTLDDAAAPDVIESKPSDFHQRVYDGYCSLAKNTRSWARIPQTPQATIDETSALIDGAIVGRLGVGALGSARHPVFAQT